MPEFDQKSATTTSSSVGQQQMNPDLLFFRPMRIQNLFAPMSTKEMISKIAKLESDIRAWLDANREKVASKYEKEVLFTLKMEVSGYFYMSDDSILQVIRGWARARNVLIIQSLQPISVPKSSGSGSLDLGKLLNLQTQDGPLKFSVSIPESLKFAFPLSISPGQTITFSLGHEAAGKSTFSIEGAGFLKGFDVQLSSGMQVYGADQGNLGFALIFISTKKKCSVKRTDLKGMQEKAAKVSEALYQFQNPESTKKTPEETTLDQNTLLFKLGGAIGDFYKALDENEKKCGESQKSVIEFGPTLETSPHDGKTTGGFGVTWRF